LDDLFLIAELSVDLMMIEIGFLIHLLILMFLKVNTIPFLALEVLFVTYSL